MAIRIRKNVYNLTDSTLVWYAEAVAAMQALPSTDPVSWVYQANIHGDPSANPTTSLPKFWDQCQHGTSFFLPWHRMYLFHFERIVAAHVVKLGGPSEWALPYWNYSSSAHPAWHAMPKEFRSPVLANNQPNPLYVAQRDPQVNAGAALSPVDTDLRPSMHAPSGTGIGDFFGGSQAAHFSNRFGVIEGTVHNNVHGAIGGIMNNPYTAALDPIFWLHHANIDRLWEVWRTRMAAHTDLTSMHWRTGVTWAFNEASGNIATMRVQDVLAINAVAPAAGLDYYYDDVLDPFPPVVAGFPGVNVARPSQPPDLVGATSAPITLANAPLQVDLPTPVSPQAFRQSRTTSLVAAGPSSAHVERVLLNLEHVTSTATAPAYDVYLNVPDGADDATRQKHRVGRATMFGVAQASDPRRQHGGGGQNFAFDITDLYHALSTSLAIDPDKLRVSFEPVRNTDGDPVSVGRISLYFS